jgi:hypothetical protein
MGFRYFTELAARRRLFWDIVGRSAAREAMAISHLKQEVAELKEQLARAKVGAMWSTNCRSINAPIADLWNFQPSKLHAIMKLSVKSRSS